jgi:glycosyltransferase involved in cell wall biosynthesis
MLRARRCQLERRHPRRDGWHSFDRDPSGHPWLTPSNLASMRAFSQSLWAEARLIAARHRHAASRPRYALLGNLANTMYVRAVPLRRHGLDVTLILDPQDTYVMSQPGWEEFDGELTTSERDVYRLRALGVRLPAVPGVATLEQVNAPLSRRRGAVSDVDELRALLRAHPYLRRADVLRFPERLSYLPILDHLQGYGAVLAARAPYLAYLAGRPYLAAQGGGDLWYEASRDDALGQLQRLGFGRANALLATNPWTFSHARRFGFHHALYLPLLMDDEVYRPGPRVCRGEWQERTGGRFFVLATSRLDDYFKGSDLALEGFLRFSEGHPEARLVLLGWGNDLERNLARLRAWGVGDKVLTLPLAGKRRLIRYLRSADCLLDQFTLGTYGSTALEAMGCGLPVVMRLELGQYEALCPAGAPPIVNAGDADGVAQALAALADDERLRREVAQAQRAWFVRSHGASQWVALYGDVLAATALGHRFGFADSPLRQPLSPSEEAHHAEGLRHAPPFPEYVPSP